MEYVEGGQINDLPYIQANKIDPFDISHKLGCLYSQMIFGEGFVHSDPHPGNILVKKNAKTNKAEVILLDHGLYAVSACLPVKCYFVKWHEINTCSSDAVYRTLPTIFVGNIPNCGSVFSTAI